MADFPAPSFSLGLDCDLFDSEPRMTLVSRDRDLSSSNKLSIAAEKLQDNDDAFETLIVDDSEPEYADPHLKLKRLRRGHTMNATSPSFSVKAKVELLTGKRRLHNVSDTQELVSTSCKNLVYENSWEDFTSNKSFCIPTPAIGEICEEISRSMKSKRNAIQTDQNSHVTGSYSNLVDSLPPAYRYFFHGDPRIQELVRNRLPNFYPLDNVLITDLEQPSTSKIDYMGQFSCAESSIKGKKSSTSRKISNESKTEETSLGWVNPKLGVNKATTKQGGKRKVHAARQTAGHWLTSPDGKKVYVGKNRQELTGRVAYMQYKRESGAWFPKAKRNSSTKKNK